MTATAADPSRKQHCPKMCMLYLKTSYTSASICTNEVVISCSNFPCDCGPVYKTETLIQAPNGVRVKLPCTHLESL